MKTHFMSLLICLTCFWSSYGVGDDIGELGQWPRFVGDNVLKYCKNFMENYKKEHLKEDTFFSYRLFAGNLTLRHKVNGWFCKVRGTNSEGTETYTVRMGTIVVYDEWSDERRARKLSLAKSWHKKNHIIPLAWFPMNYKVPLGMNTYPSKVYIAIEGFCIGYSVLCFFE